MRELRFRAWDKKRRCYAKRITTINTSCPYHDRMNMPMGVMTFAKWILRRYIIEQYTGLKDKNSKEIYEGDIVRWSFKVDRNSEPTYTADAVKWESYAEEEWPYSTISGFTLSESEDGYEVIGNIHENPELLEEE